MLIKNRIRREGVSVGVGRGTVAYELYSSDMMDSLGSGRGGSPCGPGEECISDKCNLQERL